MKISTLKLRELRNEEHYQFMSEFVELTEKTGTNNLGITQTYVELPAFFNKELDALNKVQKSPMTSNLADIDMQRDSVYRGMVDMVKSTTHHYDSAKKVAAERLMLIFNVHGNISRKNYNEETASITKLIDTIKNEYATDAVTVGINDWINQLHLLNTNFMKLMEDRYNEQAKQSHESMKEIRMEIDDIYYKSIEMLNALVLVNGTGRYKAYIEALNERIERYNQILKLRKGRRKNTSVETK